MIMGSQISSVCLNHVIFHISKGSYFLPELVMFREKPEVEVECSSKLGHWDVFLVLVQILVLRKSGEVAMMVVGTTVHRTKKYNL